MWGAQIDFQFSYDQIAQLAYYRWDMLVHVADASMSHEYRDWWAQNRFLHFTDPTEPFPNRDERTDDDRGDDGRDGGGRRICQR